MNESYKLSYFVKSKILELLKKSDTSKSVWLLVLMLSITFSGFGQITVGAGNTTSSSGPWSSCWGYSYQQMIYPQSQIASAGNITSLTFTAAGTIPTTSSEGTPNTPQGTNTNFKVYIGHTNKTIFSSTSDWVPVESMTLVFDGTLTMPTAAGQNLVVNLSTPFAYNNTDNLVIAFDENSDGYSCSYTWVANSSQTNMNLVFRNDTTNPDPMSPSTGVRVSTTPQVTLGGLVASNPPSCVTNFAPADMATDVPLNADITWTNPSAPAASSYDVYFGTDAEPMLLGNFTSASEASNALPSLLMANTTYYVKVVPKNDAGDAIGCVTTSFTTGSSFLYCASNSTFSSDTKVGSFTLAGITNNAAAGCVTYTNRTAETPIMLPQGAGVPVSITLGTCSFDFYESYAKVFIDLNQNGTFEDEEMLYGGLLTTSAPGNVASGTLTIPMSALLGNTRLRLVLRESGSASNTTACGTYPYGETQDYTVTISEPSAEMPSCVETTSPANAATDVMRNTTLSWSGATGFPTSYDIYFGTNEEPEFVANVEVASYDPGVLMANTTYYLKIVPKNENGDAEGCSTQSFTTGSGFDYCVSNSTNTADTKVGSFTLAGMTKDAEDGCVTYTDRTADAPFVLQQGVDVPVSITLGTCSSNFYSSYAKIFIDVNQNGLFDENEMFYEGSLATTSPGNVTSGSLSIPVEALIGNTRLRLVLRESGSSSNTTACGTYSYGETQDYTVTVIEPLPTTQLRTQFCNSTLASINANIYAINVSGASSYKFKVVNGENEQEVVRPNSRFSMGFASGIVTGTTYQVSVATEVNGVWSAYGPVCDVTTPMVYPTSQLRSQYCNVTLSSLNENIYANFVTGATGYKFKVEENVESGQSQEIERSNSRFSMSFVNNIKAGTTYNVSVSLLFNGEWQPYGSVCTVTTPAALPTSQLRPQFCGGSVTSLGSNFYAVFRTGAQAYKFKTMINGDEVEVVRPDSRCFMSAFEGAMMNQTYSIQVATQFNGVWSEYGAPCTLTVGSVEISREISEDVINNFEIKAYPNPFLNEVNLQLSLNEVKSTITVFDMTGKQIQQFNTQANEYSLQGADWALGVYVIQILQGEEMKNIRVVKQ